MDKKDTILNKDINNLKSLYLIYGEDKYLLDDFQNKFINKYVSPDTEDFNLTIIKDDKPEFMSKLKNSIKTVPFISEKRYVIVRCNHYFIKKSKEDNNLINLLDNIPSHTILLIIVEDKINTKLSLYKSLKNKINMIELKPPRYQDLDNWIKNEFNKYNKNIDAESIKLLEDMFNNNLQRLKSEIEKIITYNYNHKNITLRKLKEIISKDRLLAENIIFKLTDALSEKKKDVAVMVLNEMIQANENPMVIFAMIVRQVRLLLQVKVLKGKGKNHKEIARILNQHPYPIKKCYYQGDNFSEVELEKLLERFLRANYELVTGKYKKPKVTLELALMDI